MPLRTEEPQHHRSHNDHDTHDHYTFDRPFRFEFRNLAEFAVFCCIIRGEPEDGAEDQKLLGMAARLKRAADALLTAEADAAKTPTNRPPLLR